MASLIVVFSLVFDVEQLSLLVWDLFFLNRRELLKIDFKESIFRIIVILAGRFALFLIKYPKK